MNDEERASIADIVKRHVGLALVEAFGIYAGKEADAGTCGDIADTAYEIKRQFVEFAVNIGEASDPPDEVVEELFREIHAVQTEVDCLTLEIGSMLSELDEERAAREIEERAAVEMAGLYKN